MKAFARLYSWKTVAKDWRENHNIEKIEGLAQSPNLNPIENVWKLLKDVMYKKQRPKN
jgi:hypothetical protein